jgi:hypothetical protein
MSDNAHCINHQIIPQHVSPAAGPAQHTFETVSRFKAKDSA